MNFFAPDSKFTQIMSAVGEMMMLNLCWLLASLPLITMGAATTAMYTMMGRRIRQEGSGTVVPFFKAWWSNLKASTLYWAAQLFVTFSLALVQFLPLPAALRVLAAVLLILVTLVFSVVYPLIARFRNRWFDYLRNAVILLVLRLGWVLLNMLVLLIPVIVFLLAPMDFLRFGFIWLVIGFAVLFFVSAEIMQKILEPVEAASAGNN